MQSVNNTIYRAVMRGRVGMDRVDEIQRLTKWFLATSPRRRRLAMFAGGFDEVSQEVVIAMLKHPPPKNIALSTAVCNQVEWVLGRLTSKEYRRKKKLEPLGEVEPGVNDESREPIENKELTEIVKDAISHLSHRERTILELRFGLGGGCEYTQKEVGCIFKVTSERIRQIERKAIRKLEAPEVWHLVKEYF